MMTKANEGKLICPALKCYSTFIKIDNIVCETCKVHWLFYWFFIAMVGHGMHRFYLFRVFSVHFGYGSICHLMASISLNYL